MKRVLGKLVMVGALVSTASSFAIYNPNWERPILRAELEPFNSSSSMVKAVTRNKRDGAQYSTSFTLEEDNGVRCIQAPCPSTDSSQFKIVSLATDGCRSTHYVALEQGAKDRVLLVADHKNRICRDRHRFRWEVRLIAGETLEFLGGNPENVITIE